MDNSQSLPESHSIQLLPEQVIDQIKAGEVVDSPAGLLKELIENALDAGATDIEIECKNAGLESIRVRDNGKGICETELAQAFLRHSTSKIRQYHDLNQLATFGFRGEALASIAAVSKVRCISKTADRPSSMVQIHGGQFVTMPSSCDQFYQDHGSEILIQELFYNTPARLQFFRQGSRDQAQRLHRENQQILQLIYGYVLHYTNVHFTIIVDEQDRQSYPGVKTTLERLHQLTQQQFHEYHSPSYQSMTVSLYTLAASKGQQLRKKLQYILLDGRPIEDKKIHFMLNRILMNYWGQNYGSYVIKLSMPAHMFDINIHPKKREVQFEEPQSLYSLITAAAKEIAANNPCSLTDSIDDHIKPTDLNEQKITESFHPVSGHLHSLNASISDDHKENHFSEQTCILWSQPHYCFINVRNQDHEQLYLCHNLRYFQQLFESSIAKLNNNDELLCQEQIIPLLISEPIHLQHVLADHKWENLRHNLEQKLGLELDRLSDQDFVLRSVMESIQSLPYGDFVTAIIESYMTPQHINLQVHQFLQKSQPHQLALHLASRLSETLKGQTSPTSNWFQPITAQRLDQLWQ